MLHVLVFAGFLLITVLRIDARGYKYVMGKGFFICNLHLLTRMAVPEATRSEACVCRRLLDGIAGWNPAAGIFFFKVCKSVYHRTIQINHQPDVTIFQFIILTFIYSFTCFRRSPAHHQELNDCSRPQTQHGYHHDTKVKPEAATAVIELLMMGGRTPETCRAVNKRQDNKLENCCICLVIYLN